MGELSELNCVLFKASGGAAGLRSRFENMTQVNNEEAQRKKEEEKLRRESKDKSDREMSVRAEEVCTGEVDGMGNGMVIWPQSLTRKFLHTHIPTTIIQ